MMHATTVSETSGFRRSVLAGAIADSADPSLLGAVIGLVELMARARREETTSRMKVLGALTESPALGKDVAAELGLDPSTVSRHIASLEAAGLIERRRDLGDRRAHPVVATEAGRLAYGQSLRERLGAITAAVADWPAADREQLALLLDRLVADIDERGITAPDQPAPSLHHTAAPLQTERTHA